jgi:hypothetical protein
MKRRDRGGGAPTGRDVEAESPPTITARSTVGAGVFFGRWFREEGAAADRKLRTDEPGTSRTWKNA